MKRTPVMVKEGDLRRILFYNHPGTNCHSFTREYKTFYIYSHNWSVLSSVLCSFLHYIRYYIKRGSLTKLVCFERIMNDILQNLMITPNMDTIYIKYTLWRENTNWHTLKQIHIYLMGHSNIITVSMDFKT